MTSSMEALRHELEQQLPLIDEVIRYIGRRKGLTVDQLEDFRSYVFFRMVQNNYAVLRKFGGHSSLKTYLVVVIQRFLLDHRFEQWGKWRPSAMASRLGPLAVRLERLVERDGFRDSEAVEQLFFSEIAHGVTREELEDLLVKLPRRFRKKEVDPECLATMDCEISSDARCLSLDQMRTLETIRRLLSRAWEELSQQDQEILRLRFEENWTIAKIARVLDLDQRSLYGRVTRCLRKMRRSLESELPQPHEIGSILGTGKPLHQVEEAAA